MVSSTSFAGSPCVLVGTVVSAGTALVLVVTVAGSGVSVVTVVPLIFLSAPLEHLFESFESGRPGFRDVTSGEAWAS